jgi:hypothetical protein
MHDATERPRADAVRRDRRHDRGVLFPAFVMSALVHVVLFYGPAFRIDLDPPVASAPPIPLVRIAPAMQAYNLTPVEGDPAPIEVQIRERESLPPVPVRSAPPGAGAPVAAEGAAALCEDPMSVRDRLRYRLNTPQVWRAPTEEVALEPTPQDIVERRIAAQLGEYNDSVAAEAAMRERALDWTAKDADGGRWGVSPGAIHLGSITLPLPFAFAPAPGRREDFAGRVRTWSELQDQAVRVESNETFKERVKAIEERKAKERAERAGGGATTVTTGSGGAGGKPPGGGGR